MTDDRSLAGALEALLFVSDEPVSAVRARQAARRLAGRRRGRAGQPRRGVPRGRPRLPAARGRGRLALLHASRRITTSSSSYVLSWDTRRLSQAALEALAVVAYHQPVTRAGHQRRPRRQQRGRRRVARREGARARGRPRQERRQRDPVRHDANFLEKFGLKDISELPPLEEFAPDDDTERAIRDRLSSGDAPLASAETAGR